MAFLQNTTKEKEAKSVPYHVWILTIQTIGQTIGLAIKGKYKSQRGFEDLVFTVLLYFNHENRAVLLFFVKMVLIPFIKAVPL